MGVGGAGRCFSRQEIHTRGGEEILGAVFVGARAWYSALYIADPRRRAPAFPGSQLNVMIRESRQVVQ
jgi:hypothetical protein